MSDQVAGHCTGPAKGSKARSHQSKGRMGEEGLRTSPSGIANTKAGCGGTGLRPQPQKQKHADCCEPSQLSVKAAQFHARYAV